MVILFVLLLSLVVPTMGGAATVQAQGGPVRRVHVPYFSGEIPWPQSGLFWFGRAELKPDRTPPGRNYVDVRVAYTAQELVVYLSVVDYFIWYDEGPTSASDLTLYDGAALSLDTGHDRAAAPQADDFLFLGGLRLFNSGHETNYRREGRGNGAGWDMAWNGVWTHEDGANWDCNPGPNSNVCGIDYGWATTFHLPWATFGLSGPPSAGTVWGLGVTLYDRDAAPPDGAVAPQTWPESLAPDNPATWGELAFSPPAYEPPFVVPGGSVTIRRGLEGSLVEDAWVGGGGDCSGGHMGDPAHDNHGTDSSLFVANQSLIADFPCFSKSYLRFGLGGIPPGKVILSATLTLYHWGNADPTGAQPSYIQLFTVDNTWQEQTVAWSIGPLARENLTATWVQPLTEFPGWPGVAYHWDATEAVAEAYAAGQPLSIALYSADTEFHSSKYFTSSEAEEWNAEGRPALTVVWGDAATPQATLFVPMIRSGD